MSGFMWSVFAGLTVLFMWSFFKQMIITIKKRIKAIKKKKAFQELQGIGKDKEKEAKRNEFIKALKKIIKYHKAGNFSFLKNPTPAEQMAMLFLAKPAYNYPFYRYSNNTYAYNGANAHKIKEFDFSELKKKIKSKTSDLEYNLQYLSRQVFSEFSSHY